MNTTDLKPEFQIGKNGLNENIIKDIKARLKKRKIIKIKFLQSAIKGKNKEELFNNLKEHTKSKIIKKIGFTVVLKYEKH